MDIAKLIKDVRNLNGYIAFSQELLEKYKNAKIQLNMSAVLSLKNIRSLEIEYFNKCDDNGAAFIILERMLSLPPSKTWSLLGKDIISLIQYWLEAVRKHLVNHHPNWWTFMHHLLKFIKELLKKDQHMNNMLVESSTDCLLDLATRGKLSLNQRYEVLHTLNLYCADSSKEIRLAMRMQFEHYFIRLSAIMSTIGHLPSQYSIMETLLRWLLPRQDQALRREVAAKWFPTHLYKKHVVDLFLERSWCNFFQDARDFLNAHNESGELITSVICRKLHVGDHVLVAGNVRRQTYLDVNITALSVTIILEPRAVQALGVVAHNSCYTLTVDADVTHAVKLFRESDITLLVQTSSPPLLYPYCGQIDSHEVKVIISSRSDLGKVDVALRKVFSDKYQMLLDLDNLTSLSPRLPDSGRRNTHNDEDTRFSLQNKEVKRGRHAGYVVRSGKSEYFKSPSTASTTSLAQLHDKLAALPPYRFDKEPVTICLRPELSGVTELTEEEFDATNSTLKLRPCGVFNKTFKTGENSSKSQSDSEVSKNLIKVDNKTGYSDLDDDLQTDVSKFKVFNRHLANVGHKTDSVLNKSSILQEDLDENSTSCLLVATIGSADQSVINDTLERLSKKKDFCTGNIVDLLVQEAFQPKQEDERISDSGINTGEAKKTQQYGLGETIEDTPTNDITANRYTSLKSADGNKSEKKIVTKSTSDESNTDAIENTPVTYVNVRKRTVLRKNSDTPEKTTDVFEKRRESATYDETAIEDFFSQHCKENQVGDLVISPTLAKKINETSSESSDFDNCLIANNKMNINFDDINVIDEDVIDCLNNMVDQVCKDFEICSRYLEYETSDDKENVCQNITASKIDKPQTALNAEYSGKSDTTAKSRKSIKITFKKATKKQKPPPKKRKNAQNKLQLEPVSKMSTILEVNTEASDISMKNNSISEDKVVENPVDNAEPILEDANKVITGNTNKDVETPLLRRKRKLYSPKDDHIMVEKDKEPTQKNIEEIVEENITKCITPKTKATCYKEIENDRRKYKKIRSRKSKVKPEALLSPKTKKNNDMFDKLKDTIESDEKIVLADKKAVGDDIGIYNFTSDSEDEDFRKKKTELKSRMSTTTIESGNSMMSTRRGRVKTKVNYKEKDTTNSNEDEIVKKAPRKKRQSSHKRQTPTRKNKAATKINIEPCLIDEKMRSVPNEDLHTSVIVEKPTEITAPEHISPKIKEPRLELIEDDIPLKELKEVKSETKKKPIKKNTKKDKKRNDNEIIQIKDKEDDRTASPLPGLVVESVQPDKKDNDSVTGNMIDRIKKIYQNPEIINETNTTQNLLTENENTFYSNNMNLTEEINEMVEAYTNIDQNKHSVEPNINIDVQELENSIIKLTDDKVDDFDDRQSVTSNKSLRKRNLTLKKVNSQKETATSLSKNKNTKVNSNNNSEKESSLKTNNKKPKINKHIKSKYSSDDQIERIEVITIDDNNLFLKNTKSIQNNYEIERINVSDATEMKSGNSMETVGITAHGEIDDESPPNAKLLTENVLPRELADMDDFSKDYYMKLKRQVYFFESQYKIKQKQDSFDKLIDVEEKSIEEQQETPSPVVSVKKMSSIEISKWLPSIRDSESDTISSVSDKASVRIERLSFDEIAKWLPPKHNSSPVDNQIKKSETPKRKIIKDSKTTDTNKRQMEKRSDNIETPKRKKDSPKPSSQRKSIISPIKLDDLFLTKPKKIDVTEENIPKIDLIKSPIRSTKTRYPLRNLQSNSSPISIVSKKENSRTELKNRTELKRTKEVDKVEPKRRKVAVELISVQSLPSASSVEDWLKKNQASYSKDVTVSIGDVVENVMERIDTTLLEIHQNTSKNLIHLFVDVQKRLKEMKEERMARFEKTASALNDIQKSLKLLAQDVVDLDDKSQEMEKNFTEWLKVESAAIVREETRKKQTMVAMLKEDMQLLLQANKTNTTGE